MKSLSQLHPEILSRAEHETITHNKLVRKRTQARDNSAAAGRRPVASDGRYATTMAQSAVAASSRIVPPPRSGGPSPANIPPPSTSPPLANSPIQPLMTSAAPKHRVHHFGRKSNEQNDTRFQPPSGPSPPRTPNPAPIRTPISLSDPPVSAANSLPPAEAQPQSRPFEPSAGAPVQSTSQSSKPKKGPATFAEMGYHSQALDDKDCRIM